MAGRRVTSPRSPAAGQAGGGGSGGAILIEAHAVTLDGNVVANGGGGDGVVPPEVGPGEGRRRQSFRDVA